MQGDFDQPWFARALQVLDLRRKDRLLLVTPSNVGVARAVAQLVGASGHLMVVEPRRALAVALAAAQPDADVVARQPDGERLGAFDAVLAVPLFGPLPPVDVWPELLLANLRPGGRFVLDLPAPDMLPDLQAAASTVLPALAERLQAVLTGPAASDLVAVLQASGLRRVETLLGTHLLVVPSPFDLVELLAPATGIDDDERGALGDALARALRTTSGFEILAHRTAVTGMR